MIFDALQGYTWSGVWNPRYDHRADTRRAVRDPHSSCQRDRSWQLHRDRGTHYTQTCSKFVLLLVAK